VAWRTVGIVGKKMDDSHINRTHLIDQEKPAPETLPDAPPEPHQRAHEEWPAAATSQRTTLSAIIRVLTEALEAERKRDSSPQEMGVFEPKQVKKQKPERRSAS
jgi:hypothetical protein